MEDLIPVIIFAIVIFWNVIKKIIGEAQKLFQAGGQFQTLNVAPDSLEPDQHHWEPEQADWTVTELSPVPNGSYRPEQEELIIEIDDNDLVEPEIQTAPEKTVEAKVSCKEERRRRLRKAIIWSEILAPPVALRENKSDL